MAARRHWCWLGVTAWLCAWGTLLASMQGCSMYGGSSCSNGRHPGGTTAGGCSDSNHFLSCRGGEGTEYDVEVACPSDTPLCTSLPAPFYAGCRSQDQLDCQSDLPDLAGGDLRVADLNGDGLSDLVYVGANGLTVSLGSPAGGFLSGVPVASQTTWFRIEHLDADDRLDLVVLDRLGQVGVLFGNGDGSFRAPRSLETSVARLLGAGDLDGDGVADIIIETALGRVAWLSSARNFAPVEFGIERSLQANDGSTQVRSAQVWRAPDGALQLVLTDTSGQISSYIQSGDGWSLQQRLSGGLVAATDFNHDGRLDFALQDQDSIQLQLGQRDGSFEPGVRLAGSGQLAADLNGDGEVDLEIRRENGIILVLGRGDGSFEERTLLHLFGSFDNVVTTAQGPALVSDGIRWLLVSPSCVAR